MARSGRKPDVEETQYADNGSLSTPRIGKNKRELTEDEENNSEDESDGDIGAEKSGIKKRQPKRSVRADSRPPPVDMESSNALLCAALATSIQLDNAGRAKKAQRKKVLRLP